MLTFLQYYKNIFIPKYLRLFFSLKKQNIPKIKGIIVHTSFGAAIDIPLKLKSNINFISLITGRYPKYTKVKHTISRFKIKKGNICGLKVTLRRFILYNFLEKLIKLVIPRIPNFIGFSKNNFDNKGNYNFGLPNIYIFSEINFSELMPARLIHGIEITISIKTEKIKDSLFLLKEFQFPFILYESL